MRIFALSAVAVCTTLFVHPLKADENLLGYVKGAETLPQGSSELYQFITQRKDKSYGSYSAWNTVTEYEYGVTNRFTASAALLGQSIDTSGLVIDGYMPGDEDYGWKPSGIEVSAKYNFLSPALDDFGLSLMTSAEYTTLDPHSGKDKDTMSIEFNLIGQKYFIEGQLIWVGNIALEASRAVRGEIANLPEGFEWPTDAEMELEFKAGTGLSYRFSDNWFIGAEVLYEEERETEVDLERYSFFAGPSLHYGSNQWWATLTLLKQLKGGGEKFAEQTDNDLHLIEKTEQELRVKIGYNF
jgi:hypothetical protein